MRPRTGVAAFAAQLAYTLQNGLNLGARPAFTRFRRLRKPPPAVGLVRNSHMADAL